MPIKIFAMPQSERLSAKMGAEAHRAADDLSSFDRQIRLTASLITQHDFESGADEILQSEDNARTVSSRPATLGRRLGLDDVIHSFIRRVRTDIQNRGIAIR